jgi:hypothetical protein
MFSDFLCYYFLSALPLLFACIPRLLLVFQSPYSSVSDWDTDWATE